MKFGSKGEKKLYLALKEKYDCEILRRGWPDFLVITANGKIFCIEEKGRLFGGLTIFQKKVHSFLKSLGVEVFISRKGELNQEITDYLNTRVGSNKTIEMAGRNRQLENDIKKLKIKNREWENKYNQIKRNYKSVKHQSNLSQREWKIVNKQPIN